MFVLDKDAVIDDVIRFRHFFKWLSETYGVESITAIGVIQRSDKKYVPFLHGRFSDDPEIQRILEDLQKRLNQRIVWAREDEDIEDPIGIFTMYDTEDHLPLREEDIT